MKHLTLATAALLTLAACQPEDSVLQRPDTDACGASALSARVGTPVQSHSFGEANRPHRIIRPNTAVTMDHRLERLNVDVDDKGIITRIWCG